MPQAHLVTRSKHGWASQQWHPRIILPSLLALFVAGILVASSGLASAEEPDGPLTGAAGASAASSAADRAKLRTPITPPWALKCWLWEDDDSTAAAITELLDGYAKHDIPAHTIIMDAPWSMRYNDFAVDPERYPDVEKFIAGLKQRGVRVVLWMTPMVNSESNDTAIKDSRDWFEEAKSKGYLAGHGYQQKWWHGWGGFVDYENPAAMQWWRGMQQRVLDLGIDGWKLDDSAFYFNSMVGSLAGVRDAPSRAERRKMLTSRQYMDHFYRDEYKHGLKERDGDFITLARSIDNRIHPQGFAPLDAAPVTWVGDQNHAWKASEEGIEEALHYILEAARVGYCVIGSDVAGYHGSTAIPPNLYIRWAQFSCFCGLFLNGGHGERALWKRTPEELEIVRKFAWLHDELVPLIYTHVVECHETGKPLMRPLGKSRSGSDQGDFHYLFGDDILIAPIHQDKLARKVTLPAGQWRYWFDDAEVIAGPAKFEREFPLDEFPVYVRDGAIVPMDVSRAYTGLGDADSAGHITWNCYPVAEPSKFTLHHTDGGDSTLAMTGGDSLSFELTGIPHKHLLRAHCKRRPTKVLLDGQPLAEAKVSADGKPSAEPGTWRWDQAGRRLWIRGQRPGKYEVTLE